jgi:hypothetical protein
MRGLGFLQVLYLFVNTICTEKIRVLLWASCIKANLKNGIFISLSQMC